MESGFHGCFRLTNSISNMRVPNVEPSPFARRVGLKMVVNNLCLSKKLGGMGSWDVF